MLNNKSTIEPAEEGMYTDFQHQCDRELRILQVPEGVKKIGHGAFAFCDNLEEIILPEGLEEIGIMAFYGCDKLRKVILPGTVRVIGHDAFPECRGLQIDTGKIPDDDECFRNIYDAETLYAARRCFHCRRKVTPGPTAGSFLCGCEKRYMPLRRCVELDNASFRHFRDRPMGTGTLYAANDHTFEREKLPSEPFAALWTGYSTVHLSHLCIRDHMEELMIVTWSPSSFMTFAPCTGLRKVTADCTLHPYMFAGCKALEEVNLHIKDTSIPEGAFANCTALKHIYIPEYIKEIHPLAFQGCDLCTAVIPEHLREQVEHALPCKDMQFYTPCGET